MREEKIKRKILIPLAFVLLALLVNSVFFIYWIQRRNIELEVKSSIDSVQDSFKTEIEEDAETLGTLLDFIKEDEVLQNAWLVRDRQALLRHATSIFDNIRTRHRVTHFYFIEPERVCFLRVHNPTRHGDTIHRFTMDQAAREDRLAYGIELGPFGTFTLRVVQPWRIGGKLAGYLELGEEIEHIIPELSEILNAEIVIVINKEYLNHTKWKEGLSFLKKTGDWEQFDDFVAIDQTMENIPPVIGQHLSAFHEEHTDVIGNIAVGNQKYYAGFVSLFDVGERELGDIIVLKDVSSQTATLHNLIVLLVLIVIILGVVLIIFFSWFLGGLEHRLIGARKGLESEITERKRADTQINQQNEFLKNILESLSHPFYVVDAHDYTISIANSATGIESFTEKTYCYTFTHKSSKPCGSAEHICPLEEVKRLKKPVVVEHIHYDKEGNAEQVEVHGFPIFDSEGNVVQMIEYSLNIGKRKQAEEQLKNTKEHLENVIESSLDSIIVTDNKGSITRVNKSFLKLIDCKEEEVIGRRTLEFSMSDEGTYESTTGELVQITDEFFNTSMTMVAKLIENGKVLNWESYYLRSDKKIIPVEQNIVYLYSMEGDKVGTLGTIRDITWRRKVEEEIRKAKSFSENIFESSRDGIVICDEMGTILTVNNAIERILKFKKEKLIGKHASTLVVEDRDIRNKIIEKTAEFFESGFTSYEARYKSGDGHFVDIECNLSMMKDKKGDFTAGVSIVRDITERKKIELENIKLYEETQNALEELKETQAYLLQSEKMASIGQLAAGVAHEINNPIGFIHSNLGSLSKYSNRLLEIMKRYEEELTVLKDNGIKEVASFSEEMEELKKKLKMDFIMKDFQKVIADSQEGTQRIKKIVADLKNFSRVDQAEFKHADINEGIESTLNVVWNELKYKCTVEKDHGNLPQIYCNLGQLNQVFMNLLINAAQAIKDKGTIKIATHYVNGQSGAEQGYIEIKISDTGRGIPEDKLNKIFEPFFTTKAVGKGTGLGLSIAYDIIQKHKGEISVESAVGKGTTFTIQLPMMEAENKEHGA